MIQRFEEVVVLDECRNGGYCEDGRILAVARPGLMVADDMVGDQRKTIF